MPLAENQEQAFKGKLTMPHSITNSAPFGVLNSVLLLSGHSGEGAIVAAPGVGEATFNRAPDNSGADNARPRTDFM